jgi:hypothetical protein
VLAIYFNNIEFVKLQKYPYINLIITKKNMNEQDKKYKTKALVKILFLRVFFFIISLNEKYENAFGHFL